MRTNYVLVDYENVQLVSLNRLQDEQFRVLVFLGPTNTKLNVDLVIAMQKLGTRADYIRLETPGHNALDFHIAYYLGTLSSSQPDAYFHIISKDTGFDPLIKHLKSKKIYCTRSQTIDEMPCFAAPSVSKPIETTQVVSSQKIDDLFDSQFQIAVDDLISRKASKPRTVATLKNTIQAKLGKTSSQELTEKVYQAMVKKGFAKVAGTKISYSLPAK
nr:PIN domain-containing protein [uncultured Undibacterium sp.]